MSDQKVVPFKSKGPQQKEQEKQAQKKALLNQIEDTIHASRRASLHEHALYYVSIFFGLTAIFFALIMIMLHQGVL